MEKKHRCKLCFRNFGNGRALGGHMRSHMMKLYADEKRLKQEAEVEDEDEDEDEPFDDFQSVNSYSSTSSSDEEEEEFEDESEEEGEEEEVKLGDHEFSVVLQDGESETEDPNKKKPVFCRRSKRVRKPEMGRFSMGKRSRVVEVTETEPLSSISETTPEEHVAHCLIMMSRDKWERQREETEQDSEVVKVIKTKVKGKYRCEECNKLFRSYQALGGHRASHKKIKLNNAAAPPRAAAPPPLEEKIHQCPFCPRIFSSGQALGGHKRSHFIGGGAISTNLSTVNNEAKKETRIVEALNIDLNLPAPIEDDDMSQIAVSAVSDAEFVNNLKE